MYKKIKLLVMLLAINSALCADVTVYKYRIYCNTEASNVYTWAEAEPTKCPNDTSHSINTSSISIVDERADDEVKIREESTPTGGHICIESMPLYAATGPDVQTIINKSWPFPVSVLAINLTSYDSNNGDVIRIEMPYQKIFGFIAQDVEIGDTVITVNSTVMTNIAIGYYVRLDDGTTANDLGRVLAVDEINSQITVENATTDSFLAATPTYVKVTIRPWNDFEIGPAWRYIIGNSKLGASYVPANEVARISYTNKTAEAKRVSVDYEYLY